MPHSKTSMPRSKLKRGNLGVPRGPATRLTLVPPLKSEADRRAATAPSSTRRRSATGLTSGTWSTWRSTDAPNPARLPAPRVPAENHLGPARGPGSRRRRPPQPGPAPALPSPALPTAPGLGKAWWRWSLLKRGNLGVPRGSATRLTLVPPLKSKAARRAATAPSSTRRTHDVNFCPQLRRRLRRRQPPPRRLPSSTASVVRPQRDEGRRRAPHPGRGRHGARRTRRPPPDFLPRGSQRTSTWAPRLAAPPAPPARPGTSPTQPGPPGGCLRLGCWEARPSRVNDQDHSARPKPSVCTTSERSCSRGPTRRTSLRCCFHSRRRLLS
jgi:hypothetical protein